MGHGVQNTGNLSMITFAYELALIYSLGYGVQSSFMWQARDRGRVTHDGDTGPTWPELVQNSWSPLPSNYVFCLVLSFHVRTGTSVSFNFFCWMFHIVLIYCTINFIHSAGTNVPSLISLEMCRYYFYILLTIPLTCSLTLLKVWSIRLEVGFYTAPERWERFFFQ